MHGYTILQPLRLEGIDSVIHRSEFQFILLCLLSQHCGSLRQIRVLVAFRNEGSILRKHPEESERLTQDLSCASRRVTVAPFSPTTVCALSLLAWIAGAGILPRKTTSGCGCEYTRCLEKVWRLLSGLGGAGAGELVIRAGGV